MKTALTLAFGLAATLAPLAARADGQYQTIDSVNRLTTDQVAFSGVLVGGSTSQTDNVHIASTTTQVVDACERTMLLMLTHPGRYVLTVQSSTGCTIAPAKTN